MTRENEKRQVNILKNTTDGAAFLAVALSIFVIFLAKNNFKATDDLPDFWRVDTTWAYVKIAAVCLLSGLVNAFTRRLPAIGLPFSLLTFTLTYSIFLEKMLTGRPMIYIILTLVHAVGGIIYCVQWLIEERKFRLASRCAFITSFAVSAVSLALWLVTRYAFTVHTEEEMRLTYFAFVISAAALGAAGMYFSSGKKDRNSDPLSFWISVSSTCVAVILFMLRITLKQFGI